MHGFNISLFFGRAVLNLLKEISFLFPASNERAGNFSRHDEEAASSRIL